MRKLSLAFFIAFVFAYGVGVGKYQWPPYDFLSSVKQNFLASVELKRLQVEEFSHSSYFSSLFVDALTPGFHLFPELRTLEDIRSFNEKFFVSADQFFNAFAGLELGSVSEIEDPTDATNIVKLTYSIEGEGANEAFAYFLPRNSRTVRDSSCGALIIPGTGRNQSTAIISQATDNYHHGVLDLLQPLCDIFVLIKPNEDLLAGHHQGRKLTYKSILNWHLNRGGSYSLSYIIQGLAFLKQMKTDYGVTLAAGLSQGGFAALLMALQARPDVAIVSSGYSILLDQADHSGHEQIVIPNLSEATNLTTLTEAMKVSRTQYVFSWGALEDGVYGQEAQDHTTCEYFLRRDVRLECIFFDGGHIFPVEQLAKVLLRSTGKLVGIARSAAR